ncbi:MAG: Crp/Fnr family transcriptional regulator [Kaistia sp. SCN 65-12]|nr:MAG: Crp/Fnr family transcriptional regulator [Kaistia sp. SCN 65-12]
MALPLFLQLSHRDTLSEKEKAELFALFSGERHFKAGEEIVREGARPRVSLLLTEGLAARFKVLEDGGRQIAALHVPGDFLDLHGFLLKVLAHGVLALSDCTLALVEHEALRKLTETSPHLARLLWLDTLIDASVHREWLVGMGRRKAIGQLAHLMCELYVRLKLVDRTDGMSFRLPVTQNELADVLGLSIVHVNRTLRSLRRRGVIRWEGERIHIDDWDGLAAIAEFDPVYLSLQKEPR